MKRIKKMMALVIALVMVLSMTTAVFADTTPSGGLTVDDHIAVTSLQAGDTVNFYKVLKWDNGWKLDAGFTLTDEEFAAVVGNKDKMGEIGSSVAGKIGTQAASASAKYSSITADSNGKANVANPEAGLYVAIITPAKTGYTYNPVFVAADYSRTSGDPDTNEWDINTELSYSDEAMAKKSEVTLDKTAKDANTVDTNDSETVAVGDIITFTVKTTIPGFADNYTSPVFKVTDALSEGLELDASTITLVKPASLATSNYSVTPNSKAGFELAFTAAYLKTVKTATDVEITYQAKVTNTAPKSVNQEDNTVTVNFSNSPDDTTGHGTLKDKTNHYTFDIDGMLFGSDSYKATEVVKVGVDKNGTEITETKELSNGNSVGALQGAEFKLYKDQACTQEYSNDVFSNPITTDDQGRMTIKGLDAGKYWIKEKSAPAGYIKDDKAHSIEIKAEVGEVTVTEGTGNDAITYKTNVLKSYTVEIDGTETAKYTITNNSATTKITTVDQGDKVGDTNVGDDANSGKIKNTQGVELPSTGGIGTTLFYIIGAILVLGAGILLVTRRRMSAN